MYPYIRKNVAVHKTNGNNILYYIDDLTKCFYINKTAVKILEYCDGSHEIDEIVGILSKEYDNEEGDVHNFVNEYINQLSSMDIICYSNLKIQQIPNINGNYNVTAPITLSIEITKRCPLRCIHCYADAEKNNFETLNYEDIMSLLDNAIELGIPNLFITGGEAFEHKDIFTILDFASKNFRHVTLATSGFYITNNIGEKLKKYNNISYRISLDGPKEIHNKIRCNELAFDKAINAINILGSNGFHVTTVMTLSDINIKYIEETIRICKKNMARSFEYGFIITLGRADSKLQLSNEDFYFVKDEIKKLKNDYQDDNFKVMAREDEMIEIIRRPVQINCGAGYIQLAVLANGEYTPCLSLPTPMGNIKDIKLEDLLKTKIVEFFKKQISPRPSECNDCNYLMFCEGCHAKAVTMPIDCNWKHKFKKGIEDVC